MKKSFVTVCLLALAILAIIRLSPIEKVLAFGAYSVPGNTFTSNSSIYEKKLPQGEMAVLSSSELTTTATKEQEIAQDTIFNLDQEILNKSNELEFLGEKAYKQNDINLSKQIIQTYYDLLEKNMKYHDENGSPQNLEVLSQEYDNQINVFKDQLNPVLN